MKYLKQGVMALASVLGAVTMLFSATAKAENTPIFNTYKDVQGIGDESDFIRIGTDGSGGNTIEACQDGQVVDFWIYIHNGASAYNNGTNFDGPAVAHNTTLKVNLAQNQYGNNHAVTAVIDSNETTPISDDATITCGGEEVALEYVGVSGFNTTDTSGNYKMTGDPINGASIGYPGGVVPGCWEYRARVNIQVKIKKQQPVVAKECKALSVSKAVVKPREAVTVTVNGAASNATILGYLFTVKDKDGTVVDTKEVTTADTTATYTFNQSKTGVYTVSASVKFEGGNVTSDACVKTIEVKNEVPPVIPNTGAGSLVGLLAATTIAGAIAHRVWTIRRATR